MVSSYAILSNKQDNFVVQFYSITCNGNTRVEYSTNV